MTTARKGKTLAALEALAILQQRRMPGYQRLQRARRLELLNAAHAASKKRKGTK